MSDQLPFLKRETKRGIALRKRNGPGRQLAMRYQEPLGLAQPDWFRI